MKKFVILTQQYITRTFEGEAESLEAAEEAVLAGAGNGSVMRSNLVDTEESEEMILTSHEMVEPDPRLAPLNNDILRVVEDFLATSDSKGLSYRQISNTIASIAEQYSVAHEQYEVEEGDLFEGDSNES